MPGHFPTLDQEALLKLRELVKQMQSANGTSVPMPQLLELANRFNTGTGLTLDFDATHEIGQALVVIRAAAVPKYPTWAELLSPREREVITLVAAGLSNKLIAAGLFISLSTVKDHVHNILGKSGLASRSALVSQWPNVDPRVTSKP